MIWNSNPYGASMRKRTYANFDVRKVKAGSVFYDQVDDEMMIVLHRDKRGNCEVWRRGQTDGTPFESVDEVTEMDLWWFKDYGGSLTVIAL